jgi:rod shape-determining protein MreC
MNAMLATRAARRRTGVFIALLAVTLTLMALSSNPAVLELQKGVGFAFRPVQSAVDAVAATVSDAVATISEIDQLRRANDALQRTNDQLKSENARLQATKAENDQLTALLQLRSGLEYTTVAARVIARESSEFRRVVTIDHGTDSGLATGQVVIAAGGALAGRIIDIGPNFATVQLLNDTESTVIGELSSNGATGEVVGQLGGVLIMRNVDATEQVQLGDEVLTAGIELAAGVRSPYPKGLLLGQVVDVKQDANAVVQTVYLTAAANLDKLEYVLVISDYNGGLPPPVEQPSDQVGPGATLAPFGTPAPSGASPAPTPRATAKPKATP